MEERISGLEGQVESNGYLKKKKKLNLKESEHHSTSRQSGISWWQRKKISLIDIKKNK
jgi:hypothetical protein